jgi:hypothetical protein|tara:strand:- start:536 stop:844 length:309 start_codon:yes stop_codon:yes gene_type:complete
VPKSQKLPEDVIQHWPEILKDIDVKVVPLEYLAAIRVSFKDGKVWEVDLKRKKTTENSLETIIEDFFEEYGDSIESVDFRLDTKKVKADIQQRTTTFMKKRK